MKKAFTLVELAIVLVIIGVIIGVGIKGKALVESARLLSDISKMKNIETKIKMYYMENNVGLPTVGTMGWDVSVANFELNPTEKMMTLSSSPNLYFTLGLRNDDSDISWGGPVPLPKVLAITVWDLTQGGLERSVPRSLACTIELTLDDKIMTTGDGRGYVYEGGALNYDDCPRDNRIYGIYYHWIIYKY